MEKEYGVYDVTYKHENNPELDYTSLTATFGDGCMRILTNIWSDEVGINISYNKEHAAPWAKEDYINTDISPPNISKCGKSIQLVFDKVESIDAVIHQLNYVRDVLVSQKKEK